MKFVHVWIEEIYGFSSENFLAGGENQTSVPDILDTSVSIKLLCDIYFWAESLIEFFSECSSTLSVRSSIRFSGNQSMEIFG